MPEIKELAKRLVEGLFHEAIDLMSNVDKRQTPIERSVVVKNLASVIMPIHNAVSMYDDSNDRDPLLIEQEIDLNNIDDASVIEDHFMYRPYPRQMEMLEFAFGSKTEQDIRLILGFRGCSKTDIVTIYGIAREIAVNPKAKIGLQMRSNKRLVAAVENIKQIAKRLGANLAETTQLEIRTTCNIASASDQKQNTIQPNLEAKTFFNQSSKGAHKDIMVLDDPVDSTDEESTANKDKAISRYHELVNQASASGLLIIIGQPVAEDDLYALLRKSESVAKHELWVQDLPELPKDLDKLEDQGVSRRSIAKNYQGVLIPDDDAPFADIACVAGDIRDHKGMKTAFIDPAFKGKDLIGYSIGGLEKIAIKQDDGSEVYQQGFVAYSNDMKGDISDERVLKRILLILKSKEVRVVYFEVNADHGASLQAARVMSSRLKLGFAKISGIIEKENKQTRILRRISICKRKLMLLEDATNANAINKIKSWTRKAKEDDAIDSLASLLNMINGNKDKMKSQNKY